MGIPLRLLRKLAEWGRACHSHVGARGRLATVYGMFSPRIEVFVLRVLRQRLEGRRRRCEAQRARNP